MPLPFHQAEFVCDSAGEPRLDQFLRTCLPEWSRTKLQGLIQAGAVQVDGVPALRSSLALTLGAKLAIELGPPPPSTLVPEAMDLDLLYEDDDLVVVNKPAGLVVHPGAGQPTGTLVHALLHRYGSLSGAGGATRPGIVHRLDRGTSGVMVVARNDFSHQHLAAQFHDRGVRKLYLALVHGTMATTRGEVNLPIRRDPVHRVRMTTRLRADSQSREARSSYTVREAFLPPYGTPAALSARCRFSWLEVEIHTGRTHQIRVHMAALRHPVVGDRLYGAPAALPGPGSLAGWSPPRVMLHASSLELTHPRTGERLAWEAPLPPELAEALARIRAATQL